jgi:putative transposase
LNSWVIHAPTRNWLAIAVVPASLQDRDTLPALDAGKAEWPSLREAVLDGSCTVRRHPFNG